MGVLLAGAAAAVGLAATPALGAPLQADLRLTALSPVTVQPGGTLRTSGTFTTNRTLTDVVVRLEVGTTAFLSRSEEQSERSLIVLASDGPARP